MFQEVLIVEASDLVNLDSEEFWKWWSGAIKRSEEAEFRPFLVEVQGGTKRKSSYSKAV